MPSLEPVPGTGLERPRPRQRPQRAGQPGNEDRGGCNTGIAFTMVTVGLANPELEVANTMAATQAPMAAGIADDRPVRTKARMTTTRTKVPTPSATINPSSDLVVCEIAIAGRSKARLATSTPTTPPISWAPTRIVSPPLRSPVRQAAMVTEGLKCDPDTVWNMTMSTARPRPTARACARSWTAPSLLRVSAAMPLPTITQRRRAAPTPSATTFRLTVSSPHLQRSARCVPRSRRKRSGRRSSSR